MSCHKFSSNIVEKALELIVDPQALGLVLDGILETPFVTAEELVQTPYEVAENVVDVVEKDDAGRIDPLVVLCTNRFANYVMQQVMDKVDKTGNESGAERKKRLLTRLRANLIGLRACVYGKHIVTRLGSTTMSIEQ